MRLVKKIITLICVIAISLSCLVVSASAVDVGGMGGLISGVADFGQWVMDSSIYGIKLVARIFDEDVCPERPGGVNTTHSFVVNTTTKDGVLADWYVCEYCGFNSGYKADSESLSAAYDDYVATLPATGYDSSGGLLWPPKSVYMSFNTGRYTSAWAYCPDYPGNVTNASSTNFIFDCKNNSFSIRLGSDMSEFWLMEIVLSFDEPFPMDGFYKRIVSPAFQQTAVDANSVPQSGEVFYTADPSAFYCNSGESFLGVLLLDSVYLS